MNYECCRNCSNNPANNPLASGFCNCTLPLYEEYTRPFSDKTQVTVKTTTDYTFVYNNIGPCPYDCYNKNEIGYCMTTGCINPAYSNICTYITVNKEEVGE